MWGPYLITGLALSTLGLALTILALRGDPARGRRRCPRCWYDMAGTAGLTCPECGRVATREPDLFRARRRKRLIAAALLLVALGQLGWLESRIRRGGWLAAVPTEFLIIGMPWEPDWWIVGGHTRAAEDWSLGGRLNRQEEVDSRTRWAVAAASRRLLLTRDLASAQLWLDRATQFGGGPYEPGRLQVLPEPTAHALGVGIDALGHGTDRFARNLIFQAVIRGDCFVGERLWTEPTVDAAAVVNERTPRLIEVIRGGSPDAREAASLALALGDGRAEIMDVLLDPGTIRHALGASFAAGYLAARHPDALRRFAAALADPSYPRRASLAVSVYQAGLGQPSDALYETLIPVLDGGTSYEVQSAVNALRLSSSAMKARAVEGALRAIVASPAEARAIAEELGPYGHELRVRADEILELSRHTSVDVRVASMDLLGLVVVSSERPDRDVLARMLELQAEGIPILAAAASRFQSELRAQGFVTRVE